MMAGMPKELEAPTMVPNPQDWTDTNGVMTILGVARSTVADMVARGALTRYDIGAMPMYWKSDVTELGASLKRVRGRRG